MGQCEKVEPSTQAKLLTIL